MAQCHAIYRRSTSCLHFAILSIFNQLMWAGLAVGCLKKLRSLLIMGIFGNSGMLLTFGTLAALARFNLAGQAYPSMPSVTS